MGGDAGDDVAATERPTVAKKRHPIRTVLAIVLVVIGAVLVPAAAVGVWARNEASSPDPLVAAANGVISNPAVIDGAATWMTDQLFEAIGPPVLDQVPRLMRPLVRSRADTLRTKVHATAVKVLSSPEGHQLVLGAIVAVHTAAIRVLSQAGLFPGNVVLVGDGTVTIDLVPVAAVVLRSVQQDGFLLPGSPIAATVTTTAQIASLFGVQLPDDFGKLVVYRNDALTANVTLSKARAIIATAHRDVFILVACAVVSMLALVLVAARRRVAVLRLGIGVAVVSVIAVFFVRHANGEVGSTMSSPVGKLAATSFSDELASSLQHVLIAVAVVAAAVSLVMFVVGFFVGDHS